MKYNIINSPIGKLTISTDGTGITSLHSEDDKYFIAIPEDWVRAANDPLLKQAENELTEYFTNKRTEFNLPLASIKGTPFQKRVWHKLVKIPYGTTVTYEDIAKQISSPKSARAVGSAVGHNPVCIFVPCHRVIASNGNLGGYVAGIAIKQKLLTLETHK